ncbi:unnamed protein product [Notodromas monacha]|uniref:Uncharacterized protein n=1 Tax=Notodromas monacha TaxID=399045 RepID=A0A7R9BU19_9CRUS|nr:unnamed protein product [Notodromas monacha]CAG0920196.1 unnamed protein product [Notodromas monacha]
MAPKPEATPSRQLWRSPALSNIVVAALHSKSLLNTTEPESEPVIDVSYVPPNVPPPPPTPPPPPSATEGIHAAPPSREISKPRDEAAKPKLIRQRALLEEHPEETQSASQVSPTVRALSSRFEALSKSIEPSQRSCSMRDLSEKQHPQQVPAAAAEGTKLSFADLLAVWNAKDSVSRVGNSSDDELLAPKPGGHSGGKFPERLMMKGPGIKPGDGPAVDPVHNSILVQQTTAVLSPNNIDWDRMMAAKQVNNLPSSLATLAMLLLVSSTTIYSSMLPNKHENGAISSKQMSSIVGDALAPSGGRVSSLEAFCAAVQAVKELSAGVAYQDDPIWAFNRAKARGDELNGDQVFAEEISSRGKRPRFFKRALPDN